MKLHSEDPLKISSFSFPPSLAPGSITERRLESTLLGWAITRRCSCLQLWWAWPASSTAISIRITAPGGDLSLTLVSTLIGHEGVPWALDHLGKGELTAGVHCTISLLVLRRGTKEMEMFFSDNPTLPLTGAL